MQLTTKILKKNVIDRFLKDYGTLPDALILAPGRINLIGEYTDFNNGFVLPMAIDRYLAMALKKRDDETIKITSLDFNETITLDITSLKKESHSFQEYVSGCIWALKEKNYPVRGFECVIAGNIPIGAGLSSSAALELAILRAAAFCSDFEFERTKMAKLGQYAENKWVGVNCGIMDQIISAAGKVSHALKIDCNDLSFEECPMPSQTSVIILDTATRRDLVDSEYNERRQQCFNAAKIIGVPFLGSASLDQLEEKKSHLSKLEFKRARHVISENTRVIDTALAMKHHDAVAMGRLMNISHESLRYDFEVTSPALDTIVACSQSEQGCYGARMTGAGFGGCALALVDEDKEDVFIENVHKCYQSKTGLTPKIYICKPSEGVTLEEL
jgi:galactokinase